MKAFQIVIQGDEKSEYYSNYTKDSWLNAGFDLNIFPATIPTDLPQLNILNFSRILRRTIFLKRNLEVSMTDTEKACWYSHYFLWKKCLDLNEPIVIIEHDSLLTNPENLSFDNECSIIFFDRAAMGSYFITPEFARILIDCCKKFEISIGPYGFIDFVANYRKLSDQVVNDKHKMYKPASRQVMSRKHGSTIDHFVNNNKHLFPEAAFHKFLEIE